MKKILTIIAINLIVAFFFIYGYTAYRVPIKSVTIYSESSLVSRMGSSNVESFINSAKTLAMRGRKSYHVKEINNVFALQKLSKSLSYKTSDLKEMDIFQPIIRIACTVEYKNSQIDTLAFSGQIMIINSKGYEINQELVSLIIEHLPKDK